MKPAPGSRASHRFTGAEPGIDAGQLGWIPPAENRGCMNQNNQNSPTSDAKKAALFVAAFFFLLLIVVFFAAFSQPVR